jgi:hypothetical protein
MHELPRIRKQLGTEVKPPSVGPARQHSLSFSQRSKQMPEIASNRYRLKLMHYLRVVSPGHESGPRCYSSLSDEYLTSYTQQNVFISFSKKKLGLKVGY